MWADADEEEGRGSDKDDAPDSWKRLFESWGKGFEEVGEGEGGFACEGPDETRGGEELGDVLRRHGEENDGNDEGGGAEGEGVGEERDGGLEAGIASEGFGGLQEWGQSVVLG